MQLGLPLFAAINREFTPPPEVLSLKTTNAEVRRIRGNAEMVREFLKNYHYLHAGEAAGASKGSILMTRVYGLYLGGDLAGVCIFNPPSVGVEGYFFPQSDYEQRKGLLALSRLCCHPAAPFNSESFLLAQSLKLLWRDNYEREKENRPLFRTVVTYADFGLLHHSGTIYRGIGAWYFGQSYSGGLGGFIDPNTGLILNSRQGAKTLTAKDCPEGMVPFMRTSKLRYAMFLGKAKDQLATMRRLNEKVKFLGAMDSGLTVWRDGKVVRPGDTRSYAEVYELCGRKAV